MDAMQIVEQYELMHGTINKCVFMQFGIDVAQSVHRLLFFGVTQHG